MPDPELDLRRYEALTRDATAAADSSDDRSNEAKRLRGEANSMLEELRQAIIDGGTTGDKALDIQIVFTLDAERGSGYEQLQKLVGSFTAHPGELVLFDRLDPSLALIASGELDWLSHPPSLMYGHDPGEIHLPTTSYVGRSPTEVVEGSLEVNYTSITRIVWGGTLVVGDEAVQHWLTSCNVRTGLSVYIIAKCLGHPLTMTPEIEQHQLEQRELVLLRVTGKYRPWKEWVEQRGRWQRDPESIFKTKQNWGRIHLSQVDNGVTLIFTGLAEAIAKARRDLQSELDHAINYLDMGDSAEVQRIIDELMRNPSHVSTTK